MRTNVKGKSKTLVPPFPVISKVNMIKKMGRASAHIDIDQRVIQRTTNGTAIY